MEQQNYQCSIAANVSPREAFDGINKINQWWAKNFEGQTEKLNDVFTVRFGETYVTFKVAEVIPDKTIVWEVLECYLPWLQDKTEWMGTSVVFEIAAKGDSTQVTVTHVGLVPEIECYADCEAGWNQYVKVSLLKLLTEHVGEPI